MNKTLPIRRLNQVLAHVIAQLPDLHLGGVRIEVNFHFSENSRRKHLVSAHSHPWWDISMIRSGRIEYKVGEGSIVPNKNQIVLFPAGVEHGWSARRTPMILESYMLGMFAQNSHGENILEAIRQRIACASYCFRLSTQLQKYREDMWTAILEHPAGPLQAARVGQLMQLFVVHLMADLFGNEFAQEDIRFLAEVGQAPASAKLVVRMEEYLRNHLSERITMNDLEKQFAYSHRHLIRLFREQTGCSIQQYLLTKRIRTACDLLINSGARTKETAHAVGFSDVSYFCRIFREHTKFTPQQYRERHGK